MNKIWLRSTYFFLHRSSPKQEDAATFTKGQKIKLQKEMTLQHILQMKFFTSVAANSWIPLKFLPSHFLSFHPYFPFFFVLSLGPAFFLPPRQRQNCGGVRPAGHARVRAARKKGQYFNRKNCWGKKRREIQARYVAESKLTIRGEGKSRWG